MKLSIPFAKSGLGLGLALMLSAMAFATPARAEFISVFDTNILVFDDAPSAISIDSNFANSDTASEINNYSVANTVNAGFDGGDLYPMLLPGNAFSIYNTNSNASVRDRGRGFGFDLDTNNNRNSVVNLATQNANISLNTGNNTTIQASADGSSSFDVKRPTSKRDGAKTIDSSDFAASSNSGSLFD